MTDYYSVEEIEEINDSHLVFFPKPKEETKFYFDFYLKSFRPVIPINVLPYDLVSCKFTDSRGANDYIVTCSDSYRFRDGENPDGATPEEVSKMLQEREWREEIVKDGAEFEFRDSTGKWRYAKVAWTKSDIVPGVVLCGPREHPNVNSYGYFFKESTRIAKLGTCSGT